MVLNFIIASATIVRIAVVLFLVAAFATGAVDDHQVLGLDTLPRSRETRLSQMKESGPPVPGNSFRLI